MHACVSVCMYIYVPMYVHMYVCMHVCILYVIYLFFSKATTGVQLKAEPALRGCTLSVYIIQCVFFITGLPSVERTTLLQHSDR